MKRIENKKGSALIISLLVVSVIVLLGSTALTLAVTNYKMKKLNSLAKQAFYLAEAGIDEAYIITLEFIDNALQYARSKAEEFREINSQLNADFRSMELIQNNYTGNENINTIFKKAFVDFIKGKCTDISPNQSLVTVLKKNDFYIVYNGNYPKIEVNLTEHRDRFTFDIKSICRRENVYKEIKLSYEILVPEYNDDIKDRNLKAEDIITILEWKMER